MDLSVGPIVGWWLNGGGGIAEHIADAVVDSSGDRVLLTRRGFEPFHERAAFEIGEHFVELVRHFFELSKVLANLEGSTLVKRLKAASRQQYAIAGRINDRIGDVFGSPTPAADSTFRTMMATNPTAAA